MSTRHNIASKNNKFPLVSVVMPCYNGKKYIGEAIESVINQTYSNWELIIVDDGSVDNSYKIISRYLSDPRIKYIRHKSNKGIAAARNTGLLKSNGKYITLLDNDDTWAEEKLEIQLNAFKESNNETGLIFGNRGKIDFQGNLKKYKKVKVNISNDRFSNLKKLFIRNYICSITVIFKKECTGRIGYFDEEIKWGADDFDLWLRIAGQFDIKYIDRIIAYKRDHEFNYYDDQKMAIGDIYIVNKITKLYPNLEKYKNKRISTNAYRYAKYHFTKGNFIDSRKFFFKSIKNNPFCRYKKYFGILISIIKILFNENKRLK